MRKLLILFMFLVAFAHSSFAATPPCLSRAQFVGWYERRSRPEQGNFAYQIFVFDRTNQNATDDSIVTVRSTGQEAYWEFFTAIRDPHSSRLLNPDSHEYLLDDGKTNHPPVLYRSPGRFRFDLRTDTGRKPEMMVSKQEISSPPHELWPWTQIDFERTKILKSDVSARVDVTIEVYEAILPLSSSGDREAFVLITQKFKRLFGLRSPYVVREFFPAMAEHTVVDRIRLQSKDPKRRFVLTIPTNPQRPTRDGGLLEFQNSRANSNLRIPNDGIFLRGVPEAPFPE